MTATDPDEIEKLAREARAAYDETWPKGDSWLNVARFILTRERERDADWRLYIDGVRYLEEHGFDEKWTDEVDAAHTAAMKRLGLNLLDGSKT
jgi:hypothetical protein